MKDIKIVYMGTPDFSVGPLEKLIKEYNVIAVVTQPDKEVGKYFLLSDNPTISKSSFNLSL